MSGSATPRMNAVRPTTLRRSAMLTVPTGSRSSHRPPSDGSPVATGFGVVGRLADGAALLAGGVLVAVEALPSGAAAWVQPPSRASATRPASTPAEEDADLPA